MIALINELEENNISISLDNDDLKLNYEGAEIDTDILQKLKENKESLISYLKKYTNIEAYQEIPCVELQESYLVSDGQRRLWALSQLEEASVTYNMPFQIELAGDYSEEYFQLSLDAVIARHEILRTVFKPNVSGEVRQYIIAKESFDFKLCYLNFQGDAHPEKSAQSYISKDSYAPFDLEAGPLLRASLLKLSENKFVFYFNMHHIISDGWSMDVLSKEVISFYQQYSEGHMPVIAPLKIQYKDYAAWQLSQMNDESNMIDKTYWMEKLSGELPLLDLPATKARPTVKTYNGHSFKTYLSKDLTLDLKQFSQDRGGSLFMSLLSVLNVLFNKYTSEQDIIIGSPVAGRDHSDLNDQIGFYVNTLAFRSFVNPSDSFNTFYDTIKESTLLSYSHQKYSFDRLVEDLELKRDVSRNAIFDVMLTLQNVGDDVLLFNIEENATNIITDSGSTTSKFDLEFSFQEVGSYLSFQIVYNTDVYDEGMIKMMMVHFKQLLNSLLSNPKLPIGSIDYLSIVETEELLFDFNDTEVSYPINKTLIDVFEEKVIAIPNAVAIVCGGKTLTYKELDELSNQLSHYLIGRGVFKEELIPICVERSLEMMIGILGVLKSGAAYVPIDSSLPDERISYIIDDTKSRLIISNLDVKSFENKEIINLDSFKYSDFSQTKSDAKIDVNQLAYVIYTSGTTGMPKGVMIEHQSLMNYLCWGSSYYLKEQAPNFGLFTALSFDLTVTSLFLPLLNGGRLEVFDADKDISQVLLDYMNSDISCIKLTPAHINYIDGLDIKSSNIEVAIVGGDTLHKDHIDILRRINPSIKIYNEYGPTESTVGAIVYDVISSDEEILIGSPIANTNTYILDSDLKLTPKGVVGEIYLGGLGLARGYFNQSNLTLEKFINNPFKNDSKIYRTGDLGKWLPDGTIAFYGRADNQVKIRGHRIELGEIEQALKEEANITNAVVLVKEYLDEKTLIAYITGADMNFKEIKSSLRKNLPEYMIPKFYVELETIPLTSNGKVNRKVLLSIEDYKVEENEYVAPTSKTEIQLVTIWKEILGIEKIGVTDDFFELGGHSIKATRLISEYHRVFNVKLSLRDLFVQKTIEEHSKLLLLSNIEAYQEIPCVELQESYLVSDGQRRLWALSQLEEASVTYNMPFQIELAGDYSEEYFQLSLDAVIARHEILRTVFKPNVSGEVRQYIIAKESFDFKLCYLNFQGDAHPEKSAQSYISKDSYAPFDLEAGPLLRASLLKLSENKFVFYFNMHHIISDGWSMDVLSKEVISFYQQYSEGHMPVIAPLKIQYKDYAAWQLSQMNDESNMIDKTYWMEKLSGELPLLDLPATKARPTVKTYNGHSFKTYLSKDLTLDLKQFSQDRGGSLFMSLLSVLNVLFNKYTSEQDIIIGSPVAGRDHSDLNDQIGFYVNTLAFRSFVNPSDSFNTFYDTIKESTLLSYSHQKYSFDRLVEDLELKRDVSRNAIFDVMLTLQNVGDDVLLFNIEENATNIITDSGSTTSKFDLEFSFQEVGSYLSFQIVYNTDVYDEGMIKMMMVHFKQLLNSLLSNPDLSIDSVPYLNKGEKSQLLEGLDATDVAYPENKNIIDLFDIQIIENPNAVAVELDDRQLTYKELDVLSNQLAHYLLENGVQKEELIPICVERSIDMIVGILGILKSGAAYVPIDPSFPEERISYIINDTKSRLIISNLDVKSFENKEIINLDSFEYSNFSQTKVDTKIDVNQLAYVIYTSGTTGAPKGVLLEHQNVVRLLFNDGALFDFSHEDVWTMFHSFSFDFSVWEMYGALLFGGKLIIVSSKVAKDPVLFSNMIEEKGVTVLNQTPSAFKLFQQEILNSSRDISLRYIIFGGDKLVPSLLLDWHTTFPDCKLINMYGITETTVHVTYKELKGEDVMSQVSNIGKPIPTLSCVILDQHQQLVPVGVTGELYVSGAGVARGYLNRPELTKQRFVQVSIDNLEEKLFYRSGDLVKVLSNGEIEYVGRIDNQVKIRGHRVELGEIEQQILRDESISEAVVITKEENEDKIIVAYLISDNLDKKALRGYLRTELPSYMIPSYFVQVSSIPLTSNGKIDKKLLPEVNEKDLIKEKYLAPDTDKEKILAEVWKDVLRHDSIGKNDNFYNLGGDSIKSIQVVSRLKEHGYSLRVDQVLRNPILMDLAKQLMLNTRLIDQSPVEGTVKLTPIQHYFFTDDQITVHNHYNQSVILKSNENVDTTILRKTISDLVTHHDALRMIYKKGDNGWTQINQGVSSTSFSVDFHNVSNEDDELGVMAQLGEKTQASINLEDGPLFKVLHVRLSDSDRIILILHHLVIDGVSWRILLEDLSTLYLNYKNNVASKLPLKTDSFQHWSSLLQEYSKSPKLEVEIDYWKNICDQEIQPISKKKIVDTTTTNEESASVSFTLDKEITSLLKTKVHGVYNTEINDVLLTGLGMAIENTFGIEKSILKMEGHGREEIIDQVDISRTVGWFTTMYPHVLSVSSNNNILENVVNVKESLRKVPNKGIGYGVLKYLTETPLKDVISSVVFNYLGDFGDSAGSSENSIFDYSSEYIGLPSDKSNKDNTVLDVSGMLVLDELSMSIRYSTFLYNDASMKELINSYKKCLIDIITELAAIEERLITPSDLTFKDLTIDELSKLNADNTIENVYKLSPLQQGIYYHWLSNSSATMYFEQISYRLKGVGVNMKSVEKAYQNLVDRHAVLRTSFTNNYGGVPLQFIRKKVDADFEYLRLPDAIENSKVSSYINEIKKTDREKGFDLENGSQMRLIVLDLGNDEFEFIWSHHHILMDGWCVSILINDFYELLNSNKPKSPIANSLQYFNYIEWLEKLDERISSEYWKNYLLDYSTVSKIPFRNSTKIYEEYTLCHENLRIEGKAFKKITQLCADIGITQNIFIQGVWGYLLSRYNNTQDVVFGSVVSGRPADLPNVENMIGLFINTIPVRVRYTKEDTPVTLLKELQDHFITGTSHHYLNLSQVQSQSELGKDLIDHITVFENYPVQEAIKGDLESHENQDGNKLEVQSVDSIEQTNYSFEITIGSTDSSMSIQLNYDGSVYDKELMPYLGKHLEKLIVEFCDYSDQKLDSFNYLTQEEENELLNTFNDTEVSYVKEKTFVDIFQEKVDQFPDNIAVISGDNTYTYKEVDLLSNRLAHYIKNELLISKGDIVGVKLDRSEWLMISALAIFKVGGVYFPIDPSYPKERIDYLISNSKARHIIDLDFLSSFKSLINKLSGESQKEIVDSTDLAYIIYTSGSTGNPKGVMIEHEGMLNHMFAMQQELDLNEDSIIVQNAPSTFDISIWQLLNSLIVGGATTIYDRQLVLNPELFLKQLLRQNVTILQVVPSYLKSLIESDDIIGGNHFDKLSYLLVTGEAVNVDLVNEVFKRYPKLKIVNAYGPAEASDDVTLHIMDRCPQGLNVPVGKPIQNMSIYVYDDFFQLCGKNIPGEIYVSGAGIARGYLNNPELTKEKFIDNPYNKNQKLYRTGDIGRWLSNGTLEFIGRKDDQVKIRGHRIELGEIEYQLQIHDAIESSVVVIKISDAGDNELVAYIVSSQKLNEVALRKYLSEKLPDYMLPSYFIQLDALPLTSNGKVDKKSLPLPKDIGIVNSIKYVAPKTDKEKMLISVCKDVLKRDDIGVSHSFYQVGGDSIKSIQMVSRLKQKGYTLKIEHILRYPILQEMAVYLEEGVRAVDQSEVLGNVELTPIQKEFFSDPAIKNHHYYNQSIKLKSNEFLDKEGLIFCFDALTKHHDALRTIFKKKDTWTQYNRPFEEGQYDLKFYDLRDADNETEELLNYGKELQSSIHIENGSLFKIGHFRLSDGDRLVLIIHHLVIDGISWRILLEDLTNLYSMYLEGKDIQLPLKTDSFQRWATLQKEYANSDKIKSEQQYWDQICKQDVPDLPIDKGALNDVIQLDKTYSFALNNELTSLLQNKVLGVNDLGMNDVLLTGLGLALNDTFGVSKSVIKMEGHGREDILGDIDVGRTIGWFTSVFPFILNVDVDTNDLSANLLHVKEASRKIPNNGIGYGMLKHLRDNSLLSIKPSIEFNYLGDFGSNVGDNTDSLFSHTNDQIGADNSAQNGFDTLFNVNSIMASGQLSVGISYSTNLYDEETIKHLINSYKKFVIDLIEKVSQKNDLDATSNIGDVITISENQKLPIKNKSGHGRFGPIVISNYNEETFEKEFRRFLSLYPVLNIGFEKDEKTGQVLQRILPPEEVNLSIQIENDFHISKLDEIKKNIDLFFDEPYVIHNGSQLIRLFLVIDQENNENASLFMAIHHSITDMYTNDILFENLQRFFDHKEVDTAFISNFDFIKWQTKFLKTTLGRSQRDFWTNYLGKSKYLNQKETKVDISTKSITQEIIIAGDQYTILKENAEKLNLSVSALFIASHQRLLNELELGGRCLQMVLVNGREQVIEELDMTKVLGVINNDLPIPIIECKGLSIKEHSYAVYKEYLESRLYQHIPYEVIKNDFKEKTGIDISEKMAGEFNFQAKEHVKLNEEVVNQVSVSIIDNDISNRVDFKCIHYENAFKIVLNCPKGLYDESKDRLQLNLFIQKRILELG